jgi:hypothetical protein
MVSITPEQYQLSQTAFLESDTILRTTRRLLSNRLNRSEVFDISAIILREDIRGNPELMQQLQGT